MLKKKYKILVLSDLKKSTVSTVKSTVNLAKMINGDVSFFHVKKASDVVVRDNQLSAMRAINEQYNSTDRIISAITKPISKIQNIKINHSFAFGNVKNEIARQIEEQQPDIIVLGKRKPKMINIIGDHITEFVLKNYKGIIMIAANDGAVKPIDTLALGVLNKNKEELNLKFTQDLIKHSKQPLTSFSVVEKGYNVAHTQSANDEVTYVFEQGDNEIQKISNCLVKSNVNLLCVNRATKGLHNVIDKTNVSLILYANT
ncbi:universal stress protein [Cellulophaga omnivescoria]|uniref:universal stress protein n=1 Tax=Cellulophaga omnivescoria TaxID=1888890 RepID=UPI000986559A|nr:universal stress protein [Cellulophaga omnivescoria]WBU90547.1 universal stress protein [Cellulophaga omnivescoria]WKB82669.1 universal stress protein [Cellulophaga lytica]